MVRFTNETPIGTVEELLDVVVNDCDGRASWHIERPFKRYIHRRKDNETYPAVLVRTVEVGREWAVYDHHTYYRIDDEAVEAALTEGFLTGTSEWGYTDMTRLCLSRKGKIEAYERWRRKRLDEEQEKAAERLAKLKGGW